MNAPRIDLMLCYLPVAASLLGTALLLIAVVGRYQRLVRISMAVFLGAALAAVAAFAAAGGAGAVATDGAIEPGTAAGRHAHAAMVSTVATTIFGCFALVGLLAFRGPGGVARWFAVTALVLSLIPAAYMVWTAALGTKAGGEAARPSAGPAAPAAPVAEAAEPGNAAAAAGERPRTSRR